MTTVINLLGSPSSGKSTLACDLYAKMKKNGYNCELVREVAKDWAIEGRKIGSFDQIAILGEQIKLESRLFGKVDYVITDSPSFLGAFYMECNHMQFFLYSFIKDYYKYSELNNVSFVNFLLAPHDKFETKGRFQTKEKALEIDKHIRLALVAERIDFIEVNVPLDERCSYVFSSLIRS